MLKKSIAIILLLFVVIYSTGCMAHTHVIGDGAQGNKSEDSRQWYILFGLVPLNNANTAEMAKGATNYTIRTETSVLDFIINCFTGIVTVNSRTVTVTR
jgi:flagellar basal body-associated protein FliL